MAHDAAFWVERYRTAKTPWDLGRPHPALAETLARDKLGLARFGPGARAFVPGCGRGHDALALARAGWRVTAADVVPDLAAELGPALEACGGAFHCGNALEFECGLPFQLLWEHTFFCAFSPGERPAYGAMARRLLAPGGRLAAVIFPIGRDPEIPRPPFGMTTGDLAAALGEEFRLLREEPLGDTGTGRAWEERFALFERAGGHP